MKKRNFVAFLLVGMILGGCGTASVEETPASEQETFSQEIERIPAVIDVEEKTEESVQEEVETSVLETQESDELAQGNITIEWEDIGRVRIHKEDIYSQKDPEWITASLNLEWLVLDERFPGSESINIILEEIQQQNIAYEYENAKIQDEWYALDEDYPKLTFSMDSNMSPIHYWDGTYLGFVQQSYDYSGGAHGMPYWIGYVFNVQTGEQLCLVDIVSNDEIQIKEIVTQYFSEMYDANPDKYWDNAIDTVFEYTTLDSQFYLSEEGIVFYFGPYDLAPYAAGFQEIVIPYSAWDLKIELDE